MGFAKSRDYADRLHRGEAAYQADHRPEDADFGAAIAIVSVMRVANEAAVARLACLPPAKRTNLAVELANRRRHKRHLRRDAQLIDDQPRRKIVASIDHDINAVEQFWLSFAGYPLAQRGDFDIGVKLVGDPFHHVDLGHADISLGIEYLTLKIGATDNVIINDAQSANTSGCKILDRRATNSARTDDQDMRV